MLAREFPDLTSLSALTFHDWEIVRVLGNQHVRKFNRVFLLKNRKNQSFAVLKHVQITAKNEHLIPLFKQEAELNFTSKGLPQTIDFHQTENDLYLIRSFLSGIPLQEYWKQINHSERIAFLIQFFQQLKSILDEIHSSGVIHLDLKPSNILIEKTSADFEVNILDFGMSLRQNSNIQRNTLFALGYSAPELILNRMHLVTPQTDYFSLGIICWQLYTGKIPLTHPNPGIMTNLQITHPLPSDSAISTDLLAVFTKLSWKHSFRKPPNAYPLNEMDYYLRVGQQNRYADLGAVIEDLQAIQNRPIKKRWSWFRK